MSAVVIKLELLPQQYEQLTAIAQARQLPVVEMAQTAVAEWLERQEQLERAHAIMHQLGQGLGEGPAPYDVARNHDTYHFTTLQSWALL